MRRLLVIGLPASAMIAPIKIEGDSGRHCQSLGQLLGP